TLLRTVHMASALRSQQRVGDVARDLHLDPPPALVHAPDFDLMQAQELGPAPRQLAARLVEEAIADGLRHARAGVIGGRAADARDHLRDTGRACSLEKLAESVGRRLARVAPGGTDELEAAGGGELDDGGLAAVDQTV